MKMNFEEHFVSKLKQENEKFEMHLKRYTRNENPSSTCETSRRVTEYVRQLYERNRTKNYISFDKFHMFTH